MEKVAVNTIWLAGEKLIRMGGGLIMSIMTAKFLGPADFGFLNYAFAFSTFFHVITNVGLEATLVKEIIQKPESRSQILITAIFLRIAVACLMLVSALFFSHLFDPEKPGLLFMIGLLGLAFIFQSAETIEYWFQAKQESSKISVARLSAFLVSVLFRLWLIFSGKPVIWFAASLLVEAGFSSLFFLLSFRKSEGNFPGWSFQGSTARSLLRHGAPMIFSTMVWYLYSRIDQVMIGHFLGNVELGYFSVSTRIVEVFVFIPAALSASLLPVLVALSTNNESLFFKKVQKMFDLVFLMGTGICLFLIFGAPYLIRYSFGDLYLRASEVLSVQGYVCLFTFFGVASQQVFISKGLTSIIFWRNLGGSVLNIGLNYFWIPKYGILGAVYATVVSTFCVNILANLVFQNSRPVFFIQVRSVYHLFSGSTIRLLVNWLLIQFKTIFSDVKAD